MLTPQYSPTQANTGLEWATGQPSADGCLDYSLMNTRTLDTPKGRCDR